MCQCRNDIIMTVSEPFAQHMVILRIFRTEVRVAARPRTNAFVTSQPNIQEATFACMDHLTEREFFLAATLDSRYKRLVETIDAFTQSTSLMITIRLHFRPYKD